MNRKFHKDYFKKIMILESIAFILYTIFCIYMRVSKTDPRNYTAVIFIGFGFCAVIANEIVNRIKENTKAFLIKECILFFVNIVITAAFCKYSFFYILLLMLQVFSAVLIIFIADETDKQSSMLITIGFLTSMVICMVLAFVKIADDTAMLFNCFIILCFIFLFYTLTDYLIARFDLYEKQISNEFYNNEKLKDSNKQILDYQDKVHNVNTELNYQKIELAKANKNLESALDEIESQIEIMKHFLTDGDINKSTDYLLDTIMEITGASVACLYLSADKYVNKNKSIAIRAENTSLKECVENNIEALYGNMITRKMLDTFVIRDEEEVYYEFFPEDYILNAICIPAYDGEKVYGLFLVASNSRSFFERGYSFYESSIIEYSAARRSIRLYLKMQDNARRDGLTGIYNRMYYNQVVPALCDEAVKNKKPLTVSLFDIDHFKKVNDTYGHLVGDEVIKTVARIAEKYAEGHGGTVFRIGGEEFFVVFPGKDISESNVIINRLHKEVMGTAIKTDKGLIDVNISIGLASYPETCDDPSLLVGRADKAMYAAKNKGRGTLVIDSNEKA